MSLFILTLVLAPRAEAYVYWNTGSWIARANLDGSEVDPEFIGRLLDAYGLALDDTHLYWTTSHWDYGTVPPTVTGRIGRANLDGSGLDRRFITGVDPEDIAVGAEHVYWINTHYDFPVEGGLTWISTIGRAKLDGSGVEQSFMTGLGDLSGVAVDDEHVYWSSHEEIGSTSRDTIGRANLDGTGVDRRFITGAGFMRVGAVDDEHIYWTAGDAIGRANLDGTGVDNRFIAVETPDPGGAGAVAVGAGHVYWTTFYMGEGPAPEPPPFSNVIGRANFDGTGVEQCFIDASGWAVAVDELGPQDSQPPGCELPPPNEFSFGKVKKNKKRGRATLTVNVPGPGGLNLAENKKVKPDEELVEAAGSEKLRVMPQGKAKRLLNRTGKAKVHAKVTYTPDGGWSNGQFKTLKLKKR